MDYSDNTKASHESDLKYAAWYAAQPDERKAAMVESGYKFVADHIRQQTLDENPFSTEADVILRFITATQKESYEADIFSFIQTKMCKRSEQEWQQRFRSMKKQMDWTYKDIARFIGAESGDSIKATVSRKLPAMAKLAVCLFEKMQHGSKTSV